MVFRASGEIVIVFVYSRMVKKVVPWLDA